MTTLDEIKALKKEICILGEKYGCHDIRVFGSVARNESREDSDIDFLVNIEKDRSLVDFVGFKFGLETLLQKKIDVMTENGLHWTMRSTILNEAKPL